MSFSFSHFLSQKLLQKVISNAYYTDVLYFTPPYEYLSSIDQGLRDILLPGFSPLDERLFPSSERPERRFFVVKSNLGFYNIIVYLNLKISPDFFSIGPFRAEEFTSDYFATLCKSMNFPKDSLSFLQKYYEGISYVSMPSLLTVSRELISLYFPELADLEPIYIEYTNNKQLLQIDTQILNVLNDYCRLSCLGTTVHPSYVLQLSSNFISKIETAGNRNSLHRLANDICHKYCLLIKNYAFHEYSKAIRAVINYIHLHLDEDLSLSLIAEHFKKKLPPSPPLSAKKLA